MKRSLYKDWYVVVNEDNLYWEGRCWTSALQCARIFHDKAEAEECAKNRTRFASVLTIPAPK